MQDSKFLVSIITVTLNRANFLEDCILSIKNQKYPFIEHIVIDGGSTDNSLEILKKYEGTYNLKWISEKDSGIAQATNKGFNLATGSMICICDSDDMFLPETIETIVNIFQKRSDVDVVFSDVLLADQNGKIFDYVKYLDFDLEALVYSGGMIFATPATSWRKSVQEKIGGYDEELLRTADSDFFIRIGLSGAKFYHIKKFLSIYRLHPQQSTKSVDLCREEGIKIYQKYVDKKFSHKLLNFKKKKILAKRAISFIIQGDIWYVIRGALRRINIKRRFNRKNSGQ